MRKVYKNGKVVNLDGRGNNIIYTVIVKYRKWKLHNNWNSNKIMIPVLPCIKMNTVLVRVKQRWDD